MAISKTCQRVIKNTLLLAVVACVFRLASQADQPAICGEARALMSDASFRLEQLEQERERTASQGDEISLDNNELHQRLVAITAELPMDEPFNDRPEPSWTFENQPEDIRTDEPEPAAGMTSTSSLFEDGFQWVTHDGEFSLAIHNETQLDVRAYGQAHSDPVNQFGFSISRMRLYFNGTLTEPIEYSVSINKGLGDLDLLDAYFNFNYDSRLQFRVGRFRVPFTYDWYALSNQFLPTPERSVFAINYGYNRNWGLMIHGEREDERGEYAVALVNGPRNQYYDFNADKDILTYVNFRPFQDSGLIPLLEYWDFGGSMAYGLQDQEPRPSEFRTSLNATDSEGALDVAPSFLVLNEGVREHGPRHLWDVHSALYYKQLTLMAAWDTGYNSYSLDDDPIARVPTQGWHAQFSYFLTGEEITRRTFVDPLQPFDLRSGKHGVGAIELQARYDDFEVGDEIFTNDLADQSLWTNHVKTIDSGLNWYLNRFTKIYFDWQHATFAQPIPYKPGATQNSSDLFWLRFQIYL